MPARLKAMWLLAWALLRTLLRRAFGRRRSGLEQFQQNYAADGLSAVTEQERHEMPRFGRCVACGLCDRNDRTRILASGGRFRGTMSLMLSASRSMPDYRAAALGFAYLNEEDLRERELVCPTRVPMREIARFVRAKAEGARVSAPASQGRKRMPSSFPPA
jgi:succinate dehydrogenase/fumarate reductase-like Fe-S protein